MKKNNMPQLYFSNYEDWTKTTFGETILSLKSGLSRMLLSDDIGLPVVRANNINHGNLDLNNNIKYWYKKDPQGANTNNYLIEKNDLLINFINSENKMGTTALVKEHPTRPTIYTTNILNLRVKSNIDSYFIFMITKTFKYKKFIKLITKPAVNQSSFTTVDFKKYSFKLPSYEEQKQIGLFFKDLDDLISLHQQELEALKQTKQGFLQKMFPKNGEVVPVLRFESFNTNWKKDQLGSVAEVTKLAGFEFTKYVKYSDKGQIPAIRGLNVKNGRFIFNDVKFIDESNFIKLKRSNLEEGDIVFTYVGTVGEAAIVPRNVNWYLAPNVSRIRTDKLYPEYLLQLLMHPSFKQKEIVSRISTSSQPALSMENIRKFELLIPSYEEQIKIGEFFRQLDEVIELKEKELEAVKETKNGFLQKMFV